MGDNDNFGFGKFVPGFDFLQNLAQGSTKGVPQMPSLSSWVAPTLNIEELEKRISDLKAVQFWLDQNNKALAATIQALEVQKMTLATLNGMNVSMGELAKSMTMKPAGKSDAAAATPKPAAKPAEGKKGNGDAKAAAVDPLQWWGALTQQFQEIAANAMKDVAQQAGTAAATRKTAPGTARDAKAAAGKSGPAHKKAPRKPRTTP